MKITEKIYTEKFCHAESKKAYMRCIAFIATNIIPIQGKDEPLTYSIEKLQTESLPTFRLTVFCTISEERLMQAQCEICKDAHKMSYLNSNYDCNKCKAQAFSRRAKSQLAIKKEHFKMLIKGGMNEKDV